MSEGNITIHLSGLDLMDFVELQEQFPEEQLEELPQPAVEDGVHGEPGTIAAALLITSIGLQAFSTWLARRSSQNNQQQGFIIEVGRDGTVRIHLTPPSAEPLAAGPPSTSGEQIDQIRRQIEQLLPPT